MNLTEITPIQTPVTAAEISPDWIGSRRAMVQDQNIILRAVELRIEAHISGSSVGWQPIHTPTGGFDYATAEDRDCVMIQLGWSPDLAKSN